MCMRECMSLTFKLNTLKTAMSLPAQAPPQFAESKGEANVEEEEEGALEPRFGHNAPQ